MNYLEEIEQEFSKIRGRWTSLAPLDWALAQTWETKQIPLSVVFRAMDDVHKKFIAANPKRTDTINSLRYFEKGVEKEFAEWQTSQVGKSLEISTTEENTMNDFGCFAVSDETDVLEFLVTAYDRKNLPEPLRSAAINTRTQVLELIADVAKNNQLSDTDIETRLEKISADLELSLVVSIPEDVRARMIETVKRDYAQITITAESRQKLLIKQAYAHFGLPKLTLFEL